MHVVCQASYDADAIMCAIALDRCSTARGESLLFCLTDGFGSRPLAVAPTLIAAEEHGIRVIGITLGQEDGRGGGTSSTYKEWIAGAFMRPEKGVQMAWNDSMAPICAALSIPSFIEAVHTWGQDEGHEFPKEDVFFRLATGPV